MNKQLTKVLVTFGIPKDRHEAFIEKFNNEDEEIDLSDFYQAAKSYSEALIKPGIEKEAQKAGASGAISKALKATYEATKEDDSPSFEEWKKTNEAKDYAEVIKDSFAASKLKGLPNDKAITELQGKLEAAMKENGENKETIKSLELKHKGEIDAINLTHTLDHTLRSFDKKPLKDSYYKIFLRELEDKGVEIRLHEGNPTLFKKGETAPMQNDKKTAFVTIADEYNNWSSENENLFVNSAGNQLNPTDELPTGGKKSEDGKHIIVPGQRPQPVYK